MNRIPIAHDQAQQNKIKAIAQTYNAWNYWLGLNDKGKEGEWKWQGKGKLGEWDSWNNNQPDNWGNNEDCGELRGAFGWNWNDMPCYTAFPFICRMD